MLTLTLVSPFIKNTLYTHSIRCFAHSIAYMDILWRCPLSTRYLAKRNPSLVVYFGGPIRVSASVVFLGVGVSAWLYSAKIVCSFFVA